MLEMAEACETLCLDSGTRLIPATALSLTPSSILRPISVTSPSGLVKVTVVHVGDPI
jgi:hypothetical protein